MSATTPALRGGIGSQRLGAALTAIALAIVVLVAIAGAMSLANRTTVTAAPAAAPAPASVHDRGWAMDSGKLATPMFSVPGDHAAATDGSTITAPKAVEPGHHGAPWVIRRTAPAPTNGGRGTRMEQ
jgi:hypothetical protein